MDLNDIKFPESSYNDIVEILDNNFGEIDVAQLSQDDFIVFMAATINAAYKIGFRDGSQKKIDP